MFAKKKKKVDVVFCQVIFTGSFISFSLVLISTFLFLLGRDSQSPDSGTEKLL